MISLPSGVHVGWREPGASTRRRGAPRQRSTEALASVASRAFHLRAPPERETGSPARRLVPLRRRRSCRYADGTTWRRHVLRVRTVRDRRALQTAPSGAAAYSCESIAFSDGPDGTRGGRHPDPARSTQPDKNLRVPDRAGTGAAGRPAEGRRRAVPWRHSPTVD